METPHALHEGTQDLSDKAVVEKEMTEALQAYLYQDRTMDPCPKGSRIYISKVQDNDVRNTIECDTAQWKGLTLPDLVRKDITYEDLTIAHKERRKLNRIYVEDHQMSYNPAQLGSIVLDGLQNIFPRLAVNTSGEFAPHLLIPAEGIPCMRGRLTTPC